MTPRRMTRIASIAALYAAMSLLAMITMSGLAWGPVQFRLSEALVILALFSFDAVPGLTLGCVIANVINVFVSGLGPLGILDVVFGSLATLCGALFTWKMRRVYVCALSGPVLFNALIVAAYLPLMLQGIGYYTIPFTTIELDGSYLLMYLFGIVAVGFGEAVVVYLLGLPLAKALQKTSLATLLKDEKKH